MDTIHRIRTAHSLGRWCAQHFRRLAATHRFARGVIL